VVTSGGSSLIVKSGIEVAGGVVTVDGEKDRGLSSLGSPELLADKEGLAGGGNAVSLEVDVDDGVGGGGPRASDGNASGGGVDSLGAGESLDVAGGVSLGILGGGGVGQGGRVGGIHSVGKVSSGNSDAVDGVWQEVDDFQALVVGSVDGGGGSGGDIDAVVVEGSDGIGPFQANGDDVLAAGVDEVDGGEGLREGSRCGSGSGDGVGPRVGVGARSSPGAARGPGVRVGP